MRLTKKKEKKSICRGLTSLTRICNGGTDKEFDESSSKWKRMCKDADWISLVRPDQGTKIWNERESWKKKNQKWRKRNDRAVGLKGKREREREEHEQKDWKLGCTIDFQLHFTRCFGRFGWFVGCTRLICKTCSFKFTSAHFQLALGRWLLFTICVHSIDASSGHALGDFIDLLCPSSNCWLIWVALPVDDLDPGRPKKQNWLKLKKIRLRLSLNFSSYNFDF